MQPDSWKRTNSLVQDRAMYSQIENFFLQIQPPQSILATALHTPIILFRSTLAPVTR